MEQDTEYDPIPQAEQEAEERFGLKALMAATIAGGIMARPREAWPLLSSVAIDSVTVTDQIIEYLTSRTIGGQRCD